MDEEKKPVVFIVDDELHYHDIAVDVLEPDYSLRNCRKPTMMVEAIHANLEQGNTIDLFVIDYRVPGMNGWELCGEIYTKTPCGSSPIIMASSNSLREILEIEGNVFPGNIKSFLDKRDYQDKLRQTVDEAIAKYPIQKES